MTLPTHLVFGLIIGKVTGNYPLAVLAAIAVDVDHIVPFAKSGALWSPRKLWHVMKDRTDRFGTPRYILHNVFVATAMCIGAFIINTQFGIIVSLSYLSHLFLDAIDDTIYYPFYPNTSINIRGPIEYFSKQEIALVVVLVGAWILI